MTAPVSIGTASAMTSQRRDALTNAKVASLKDSRESVHRIRSDKEIPALQLKDASLSFGGVKALTDVALNVMSGEVHAIIGPNGAGKSSLINVISGYYRLNKGNVHILGNDYNHVPTERLADIGVARTYQNIALFKGLNVYDNVATGRAASVKSNVIEQLLGLKRARLEKEKTQAKVEEMLDYMHLHSVRDRRVSSLPYGVQKRVELARALVVEPKILLLDEPMAGMTGSEKKEMCHFIRDARTRYGTTIIIIEHDVGIVIELSDQISVLDYGRKIANGIPSEVMKNPAVIDAYLGTTHGSVE